MNEAVLISLSSVCYNLIFYYRSGETYFVNGYFIQTDGVVFLLRICYERCSVIVLLYIRYHPKFSCSTILLGHATVPSHVSFGFILALLSFHSHVLLHHSPFSMCCAVWRNVNAKQRRYTLAFPFMSLLSRNKISYGPTRHLKTNVVVTTKAASCALLAYHRIACVTRFTTDFPQSVSRFSTFSGSSTIRTVFCYYTTIHVLPVHFSIIIRPFFL